MRTIFNYFILLLFFTGCSEAPIDTQHTFSDDPDIWPNYLNVTIPPNIAPLNFRVGDGSKKAGALFRTVGYSFQVSDKKGEIIIPVSKWKKLLKQAAGRSVTVTVVIEEKGEWLSFYPFKMHVAPEPVDPYLVYRLIEPGYELWNRMGIYQRNLESYRETAIVENKMTDGNCMNCHSFCMQHPERMLFHMRDTHAATYLLREGKVEKLDTYTEQTGGHLVYPSWHPSGKYVAFSVNQTQQAFHTNDPNRIEVFDKASDVVVYDVEKQEIVTAPSLFSPNAFETFPTFSPDGKRLYFCSAKAKELPVAYDEVKYSLCAIAFDPENRTFRAEVDTLYNAAQRGGSVSYPRVSPDGRFLMYSLSDYGNFSIWHKEADLYLIDLSCNYHISLNRFNSRDTESYHSWSSNSRWVVFSSRRMNGLYTRPFVGYIDENGEPRKPFLVPQKDLHFYDRFMKSYNIPEFVTGKVKVKGSEWSTVARKGQAQQVKYVE
ncbi:MAG: hypothetical protein LUD02_04940 [Tannerellaceae bacterium]|nr:hypothetical protein [Tannerellaceae bacterium]